MKQKHTKFTTTTHRVELTDDDVIQLLRPHPGFNVSPEADVRVYINGGPDYVPIGTISPLVVTWEEGSI